MKRAQLLLSLVTSAALLSFAGCEVPPDAASTQPAHPELTAGIADTLEGPNMSDVSTLVELIKAAGLETTLNMPGQYTLFAPTNAAFAKWPHDEVENLKKPENKGKLVKILTYHLAKGDWSIAALSDRANGARPKGATKIYSVTNDYIDIDGTGAVLKAGNDETPPWGGASTGAIVKPDILARNGRIHLVDIVFWPE